MRIPSGWKITLTATLTLLLSAGLAGCGDGSSDEPTDQEDTTQEDTTDQEVEQDEGPVVVDPLVVEVVADPEEGNAPLDVQLTCKVTGAEPEQVNYLWQIGQQKSSQETLSFTFYAEGDYNTCCQVWRKDGLGEPAENCKIVRVKTPAELSITSPKVDGPAETAQGKCLPVSLKLTNNGGKVEKSFDLRCVLSPFQEWDEGTSEHIELKSITIDGMESGQHITQTIEYDKEEMCIPEDVADGEYFLLCKADADDAVNELNKGDNAKFATTFIVIDSTLGKEPDLTISKFEIPQNQEFPKNWGSKLSYELTIENVGDGDAENQFQWQVHLCDSAELDDDCIQVSDGKIFSMGAGAVIPILRNWTVPDETPDGEYCLVGSVDVNNSVGEQDEENNTKWSAQCFDVKFLETLGKDLAITSFKCSPTDAVWNGNLAIEMDVTNLGNTDSGVWDYQVFLSQNPAPTPATSWKLCKGNSCKGQLSLAGGEVATAVKTAVTIPGDMPLQEYHCIVKLDPDDEIIETDEGNNFGLFEQKVSVQSKAFTDVYVKNVSFSPAGGQFAGKQIKVTYELGNDNSSTAAGVKMCVVLSVDNKTSTGDAKSGKDVLISEESITELKPDKKLTEEEIPQKIRTVKATLPLALHHTIGSYYVGVISDCDNALSNDTQKNNNIAMSTSTLTVIQPQGGCFEDDLEPNGTQELATEIGAGLTEGLGSCNDDDWYKIKVPVSNTLVVDITSTETLDLKPKAFDLDLELRDPTGAVIDSSANTGGKDSVLAFVAPEEAYYFLRVKPKKSGTEAHYALDVQLTPPLDGVDLFPTKVKANPIITFSGGALYLDWKLVNLGKDEVTTPFKVGVYFSTDDEIDTAEDLKVGELTIEGHPATLAVDQSNALVLPPNIDGGSYFVGLVVDEAGVIDEVDETNNVAVASQVTIDATAPCEDDLEIFEPNNTLEEAAELSPQTNTYEALGVCPDLDDWYKIELQAGKSFVANVAYKYSSSKGFLYLQLYDTNGTALLDEGTKSSNATVDIPWVWDAGIYWLRVYNPKKSGKAKPYVYDLEITIEDGDPADECPTDQYETNNDGLHAAPVGCGLKQMTLCKQDTDWLSFDLPPDSQVELTLDNEGSKLKLEVYTDPEGTKLLSLSGNGKTTVSNGDEPKTYYLKVITKTKSTKVTNFSYTIFFDGIAGVDLQIQNPEMVTGEVYQGEDEVVGFEVINQCLDTVPDMNFGIYLSENGVLEPDTDILVHEAGVGEAIEGKIPVGVLEKFTVPFDTPKGVYNVFILADHDQQVVESNEENNHAVASLKINEVCIDDGQEPNNYPPAWAASITPGLYEQLQVCPFDLDWYVIELFEGDVLSVTALFTNADGDLDLRLYASDDYQTPLVKAFQTNDGETLQHTVVVGGKYYLRVNGLSGASNSYDLDVSVEVAAP